MPYRCGREMFKLILMLMLIVCLLSVWCVVPVGSVDVAALSTTSRLTTHHCQDFDHTNRSCNSIELKKSPLESSFG
jgi:hypothetical protein